MACRLAEFTRTGSTGTAPLHARRRSPLVQQVLDVPQRQRVADVHHHGQADDLGEALQERKMR